MLRRGFLGTVAGFTLAACAAEGSDQAALDDLASSTIQTRGLMGIGIAVRDGAGRDHASSAGRIAPAGPAYDGSTSVQVLGSVTKLFTMVMVMQLVEAGALSLDQAVAPLVDLPELGDVTIRELLEHRSGINEYIAAMTPDELGRPWAPRDLVRKALSLGPIGPRGDEFARYANTNFTLLALAVEAVTDQSWSENLAARIAGPLGLVNTFDVADRAPGEVIEGFVLDGSTWQSTAGIVDASIGWGVGSLTSTTHELHRFTNALFDGGLFRDRATLDALTASFHPIDPALLNGNPEGTSIGLALHRFEIDGTVLVGHIGHILGYDTATARDPDTGAVITVTTNTEAQGAAALTAYDVAVYLHDA